MNDSTPPPQNARNIPNCTKWWARRRNFSSIPLLKICNDHTARGVTGGWVGGPDTSDWEISADLPGKKGKLRRKEGKLTKGRWKIEDGRRNFYKMRSGPSLFETTEIVLGLSKWKFSTGKKHFTPGKNQENDFAPGLRNPREHGSAAPRKRSRMAEKKIDEYF